MAHCTSWAVNPTLATTEEWGDSDSSGWTCRAAGRRDATFTAEGKYGTESGNAYDLFQQGDIAAVKLFLNASALYWYFPRALCSDFNLTVDMDSEAVISWTSSWGADGICYKPGDSP